MNWLTPRLILEFVIGLSLLIIIHELGHFLVSRWLKIEVEEFGIGFPPRIRKLFTWGGTDFTINWIFLGGFVRPKGENDPSVEGGLAAASPWSRLAVYFAGPIANLLVGAILFTLVFYQLGSIPDQRTVQLQFVEEGSPAWDSGLREGDIILKADGKEIRSMDELRTAIYSHLGEPMEVVYLRGEEQTAVIITPRENPSPEQGALGIIMANPSQPFSWGSGMLAGVNQIGEYTRALSSVVGRIVSGNATSSEVDFRGVVGIGEVYVELRQAETAPGVPRSVTVLIFYATISTSLGLLNLLPIPAVDGGRILLTMPEIIIGRRIPQEYENWINGIGFILVFILLILVNIRDVYNLFTR
jgi:regulator of sigma E protease